MIEIVRSHARSVKHWQRGDMRLRWAAAGMLEAVEADAPQAGNAEATTARRDHDAADTPAGLAEADKW